MRLSLTYPGRSRDQRRRDKSAALLALPPPPAGRRRSGSPLPARSSTKMLLSARWYCNSPSFPFLNSFSSPSLFLSLQTFRALRKHRGQIYKNKTPNPTTTTKKPNQQTKNTPPTNFRISAQPCKLKAALPAGHRTADSGQGAEPGRMVPRVQSPCPAASAAAPGGSAPSRTERSGSRRKGQRQEGPEGGGRGRRRQDLMGES